MTRIDGKQQWNASFYQQLRAAVLNKEYNKLWTFLRNKWKSETAFDGRKATLVTWVLRHQLEYMYRLLYSNEYSSIQYSFHNILNIHLNLICHLDDNIAYDAGQKWFIL